MLNAGYIDKREGDVTMKSSESIRHLIDRIEELTKDVGFIPTEVNIKDQKALSVAIRLHEQLVYDELMADFAAELKNRVNRHNKEKRERHEAWKELDFSGFSSSKTMRCNRIVIRS